MLSMLEKTAIVEMIGGSAMNQIKIFGLVLFVLLLVDLPMILLVNKKMYSEQYAKLGTPPSGYIIYLYAAMCYILMAIGLQYFAVSQGSFLNSLILGLVVYGVYNTTLLTTLDKYETRTAGIDTAWGTVLFGIVYLIVALLSRFLITTAVAASGETGVMETETTTDV